MSEPSPITVALEVLEEWEAGGDHTSVFITLAHMFLQQAWKEMQGLPERKL